MKIEVTRVGLDEAPLVQKIFESSPEYFRNTDRSEVLPHFAVRELTDEVPVQKRTRGYEKVFCKITVDGAPVGVVDLHRNHPVEGTCYLSLLLIDGKRQGEGLGRSVLPHIESFIAERLGCGEVLLGVSEDNDVGRFWEKVGFERNGRRYVWEGGGHANRVFELRKKL